MSFGITEFISLVIKYFYLKKKNIHVIKQSGPIAQIGNIAQMGNAIIRQSQMQHNPIMHCFNWKKLPFVCEFWASN